MVTGRNDDAGRAAAVVLASGAGSRVGSTTNKVYLPLAGHAVLAWSLAAFAGTPGIDTLVLVTRPADDDLADEVVHVCADTRVERVHGGASRQESELAALRHLAPRIEAGLLDTVLLHDGARPLVSTELIGEVLRSARAHGGAVPGFRADDLVEVTTDGETIADRPRDPLIRVQTPQGFRAAPLLQTYERAARDGFTGTDTASCVERDHSLPVRWVPGDPRNFKITYAHDLAVAERILPTYPRHHGPESTRGF